MRSLRATRIAVEAETLRLRLRARRLAVQIALGVIALAFLICAVAVVQAAAWYWLRLQEAWTEAAAAGVLAAADFLIGVVVALAALRLGPGRDETAARLVRETAWGVLLDTAVWSGILLRVLRLLRRRE